MKVCSTLAQFLACPKGHVADVRALCCADTRHVLPQ